jgi:hypothetical protein
MGQPACCSYNGAWLISDTMTSKPSGQVIGCAPLPTETDTGQSDYPILIGWVMKPEREDWLTCIDAMEAKSWTLILMGQPESLQEADKILAQAYELCDYLSADDATKLRYHLANDMTMRELRQHPKMQK